ncbi:MAG TPA: hypothetical protein VNX26_06355 [Candidatus Acidoferrum sp.]|jgi:hypothetical protein|nr:hypothetical protein [Candidatus Acidoferrum sp.]
MKPTSLFLSHCFSIFTLLLIIGLTAAPALAQSIPEHHSNVLALGTVTVLGSATCPGGATKGATCTSINVACPSIPDLTATLSQALPTGTAKGTIILHSGSGGTTFFNSGFANAYLNDGFRVVQLAWTTDWEVANGVGLKSASCRGATVFKYVFDNVQGKDRSTGFCAQGTSGGGAAIAYSLTQYGLGNFFDYVVIAAGPGVARVDYGCDASLYTGPPLDLCPLITSAPYVYSLGSANKVNTWENTTSCLAKSPLQSDIKKWAADSIVAAGANFTYPKTAMSWYFCATPPVNNSTGEGKFLIDRVVPKNNPPDVNCYSGVCKGEAVWQDPNAFNATQNEMIAQCVPNHQ